MLNPGLIARSTAWEIQAQLDAVEKNIEELEFVIKQQEFIKKDLKISLCLKLNGQHKFISGKCECGAMDPNIPVTSFKGA